jgi:hypothetical protein
MHHAPRLRDGLRLGDMVLVLTAENGAGRKELLGTTPAEESGHVRSQLVQYIVHDSNVIRAYAHAAIGRVQMLSPGVGWGDGVNAHGNSCVGCVER